MNKIFKSEIIKTANKINCLKSPKSFAFSIVTDTHLFPDDSNRMKRFSRTLQNLRAVNSQAEIDALFHLGDTVWYNPKVNNSAFWTNKKTAKYMEYTKRGLLSCNRNVFFVSGNHDGTRAAEPDSANWYTAMVQFQSSKLTSTPNKMYYYTDFPSNKLRVVCLSSCYKDLTGAHYGFYSEQLNWFKDVLNNTPSGYGIFLFAHISPIDAGSERFENKAEFCGLLAAFKSRSKYCGSAVTADFNHRNDCEILAMFVGHGHVDWSGVSDGLPFRVIETACNHIHIPQRGSWIMPEDCVINPREYGTVSEDLWDTVVYNPQSRKLHIVRFGSGIDREFTV